MINVSITRIAMFVSVAAFAASTALAGLVDLPTMDPAEMVVFSEDFSDNSAGWTLNSQATIAGGELSPVTVNGGEYTAVKTFAAGSQADLSQGATRVYFRARTQPNGGYMANLAVMLTLGDSGVAYLRIRPEASGIGELQGRQAIGGSLLDYKVIDADAGEEFTDLAKHENFMLELVADPADADLIVASLYHYDETAGAYVLGGTLGGDGSAGTEDTEFFSKGNGLLVSMELRGRNTSGPAYFDAVTITQTPEPASMLLLTAGGLLAAVRRRR